MKKDNNDSKTAEKTEGSEAKILKTNEGFRWTNGTTLEKSAFVGSVVFLISSVVFLIFEFTLPKENWPFAFFDLSISLALACEALTHWRTNRKIAIITGVLSIIFIVLGILRITGIVTF